MKKNPWLKVLCFGGLTAATVGLFLFNLSMSQNDFMAGGSQAIRNLPFTALAAICSAALLIWAARSAWTETHEPEELSAPSPQEKWEVAHPELTDGSLRERVEKEKEKHGVGYWVQEFSRLSLFPLLLMVGVFLGVAFLLEIVFDLSLF